MGKNERALLPKDKSGRGVSCKATDLCYFTEREFSEFEFGIALLPQKRKGQHRRIDDAACAGIFINEEADHTRPAKACSKSAMMSSGSSSPMEMRTRPSEMPEALSSSEV